ncbi:MULTISPECIES: hypothetical protein [unclassified Paenibacillus]|uniref:hypothetical protein n=1 Tax=unclassified Paenibacillus TaxID=185978 RepID=UPI003631F1AD
MKKCISMFLSFVLLSAVMVPFAHAEEVNADKQLGAPSTEAAAEKKQEAAPSTSTDEANNSTDKKSETSSSDGTADKKSETPSPEAKVVKTSEAYDDLKALPPDLQEKFNFFIKAGALRPEKDGWFGANSPTTRDEFVQVAKAALSQASGEALTVPAYIEAFESLGLTNTDGMAMDSTNTVSRQDLAKFMIYGLGKANDARKVTPITDQSYMNLDNVQKGASRFVTLALQLKLVKKIAEDGYYHGDSLATRRMLVESAYEAKKINAEIKDNSKISIVEAKAAGARKASVTINKMIDSVKSNQIKLVLKRDGGVIDGVTEWSADNKTATITTQLKLKKGNYTIELSGLDDDSFEKKTAEFAAEDEQFKTIEFVNSTNVLPQSKVTVYFKQLNQYGEETDLTSHNFQVSSGSRTTPQNVPGKQAFKLDLSKEKRDMPVNISIFDRTNNLTVNKTFTVGDPVVVSKIEMGDLKFKNENKYFMPGDVGYLAFAAYDQYGNRMDDIDELNRGMVFLYDGEQLFEKNKNYVFVDYDDDGFIDLELKAYPDIKKDTASIFKIMAIGSGESATKPITVFTPKQPASVTIKEYTNTLARSDKNKVIELEVRDSDGILLSDDRKLELFKAGLLKARSHGALKLGSSVSGELGEYLESGPSKGNIGILEVTGTGKASVEVTITDVNKTTRADYELKEERVPQKLDKLANDPAFIYTLVQKNNVTPTFMIKDQYDEEYVIADSPKYQVRYELKRTDGDLGAFTGVHSQTASLVNLTDATPSKRVKVSDVFSKGIKITATDKKLGSYQLTTTLLKVVPDSTQADYSKWAIESEMNSITHRFKSYTMADLDEDLTYAIDGDTSLFAVGAYLVKQGLKVNKKTAPNSKMADQEDAADIFANRDALTKTMGIKAYNKDGVETSVSGVSILSMQIADPNIVALSKTSTTKLVGLNPGTTTGIITFSTPKGAKALKTSFTVWTSDLSFGGELKVPTDKKNTNIAASDINGKYIWDSKLLQSISVNDDLLNAFVNKATGSVSDGTFKNSENLTPFMGQLTTQFQITNITYKAGTLEANKDTLYMDDSYKLVFKPKSGSDANLSKVNISSFTITVTAGNKTAVSTFTINK